MKALTLTQPWASLVILGHKRIETRSWPTRYAGPLAIHAAAGWSADDRDFASDLMDAGILPERFTYTTRSVKPVLPLGCVLGTARLVQVVPTVSHGQVIEAMAPGGGDLPYYLTATEREYGDFGAGRFAWLLTDVRRFTEPVPARGALGLWEWADTAGHHMSPDGVPPALSGPLELGL